MKLYIYDHCPFCVRARMMARLKSLSIEEITLASDDEATPISLIGQKMLPILVKEDGTAMGESLDIVAYLDQVDDQPMLDQELRPELLDWFQSVGAYLSYLVMPRLVRLGLEDFEQQSAIDYFTQKKEAVFGNFEELLAKTVHYLPQLQADLERLEGLIEGTDTIKASLSLEDIYVFPVLRNVSAIKGVTFPAKVKTYMEQMAARLDLKLFTDKAI